MRKLLFVLVLVQLLTLAPARTMASEWTPEDFRDAALPQLEDAAAQMQEYGTDSALLYHKLTYGISKGSYAITEDIIWWDRSGHGVMSSDYLREFLPGVKVKAVQAFTMAPFADDIPSLQASPVLPLARARIHIQDSGDDDALTSVVVAFDNPVPGEVRGVRIVREIPASLSWRSWVLAGDLPLIHAEVQVLNDDDVATSIFGFRFPDGMMQQEILDRDSAHVTNVRVWARNIAPIIHEPFAPDRARQSPRFALAWRGSRYNFYGNKLWWLYDNWNQVGGVMASVETEVMRDTKKACQMAEELAGGLPPREAAGVLYRFVQTELQARPSWAYYREEDLTSADKILKTRAGSADERAYLLVAMLRGLGLDARLVWAHDPRDGAFVQKYPAWMQLPVPLVRVRFGAEEEMWFDLECLTCPADELRSRLRHTTCLLYDPECAEEYDHAVKYSLVDGERRGRNPYALFQEAIRTKLWALLQKTPGSAKETIGAQFEDLVLARNEEGLCDARVEIRAWGRMDGLAVDEDDPTPAAALATHAGERYPFLVEPTEEEAPVADGDTVVTVLVSHEVEVPEPMGSTWILPPELVFGSPLLEPWPEPRRSPFSIQGASTHRTRISIPLPEGWNDVVLPTNQTLGTPILRYSVRFRVEGENLVMVRDLIQGTVFTDVPAEVASIGKHVEKMILLETSPVVVKRRTEP